LNEASDPSDDAVIQKPCPAKREGTEDESTNERPTKSWIEIVDEGKHDEIKAAVSARIRHIIKSHKLEHYLTLLLFDQMGSIGDLDLNRLYDAAYAEQQTKDILLILHSTGGRIEPAYLISKSLKAMSYHRFVVAVPRMAKSAATLVCLGADEIHMGLTSQLGPIDPQIGGLPALGLGNALDALADLACRFPAASEMLSGYLRTQLDLRVLGYFNRVTESAVQYGERLLAGKELAKDRTAHSVSDQLVNLYKDHGFVIDIEEAKSLLGDKIIKTMTAEYVASNEIFKFLDLFKFIIESRHNERFYYGGGVDTGLIILPNTKKS
jgi:hypothetical protein